MKNIIYIFVILILFVSCSDSNKKKVRNFDIETSKADKIQERFDLEKNSNPTLSEWVNYYQNLEPNFSLNSFEFKSNDTLVIGQGNVFGNFDKNFDKIYSDFLVYRDDRKQYVDFDSYNWMLNENNLLDFSPDQEINLVDIKNKTVNRIAFRGPSQWVENVFWQNDSTIVLLENNYEKQPNILKFNLKNKTIKTFIYRDTLNFESEYSKLRFKQKGLSYE